MRVTKKDWRGHSRPYSIDEAVEHVCDGSDYDRGQIETVRETARQTSRHLGELVEMLHKRGLLDNEAVLEFLGDDWHIAKTLDTPPS